MNDNEYEGERRTYRGYEMFRIRRGWEIVVCGGARIKARSFIVAMSLIDTINSYDDEMRAKVMLLDDDAK